MAGSRKRGNEISDFMKTLSFLSKHAINSSRSSRGVVYKLLFSTA
jgi:hypothetical protein